MIADPFFQRIFAASILMVRNTTSLLAMVRANVGVTVLPRLAIDKFEQEPCFLPVADPLAQRQIGILHLAHTSPSPVARSFERAIWRVAAIVAKAQ